jgi:type III restriction enzyme
MAMKLKFKRQAFQTMAVEAVTDCFAGQPVASGIKYRIDPGKESGDAQRVFDAVEEIAGFKNTQLAIGQPQLLKNIRDVQRQQNLPESDALVTSKICPVNLDSRWRRGPGRPTATSRRCSR